MSRFDEVADRVWVARHERFDLNITAVAGDRGVLVVDTHGSEQAGRGVRDAVRGLGVGRVVAVVNTHEHFDHVLGNAVFRDDDPALPIHAHEVAAARTAGACQRVMAAAAADPDPFAEEVCASRVVAADRTFRSTASLDLGDREVQLRHVGRGHTAGDLVVVVPDADVLLAGDLVEESAPPVYGADSHPMDWPATVEAVVQMAGEGTVVVPGHGAVVDRAFVAQQQAEIALVAARIRACHAEGLAPPHALASGGWPWDPSGLGDALQRGYAQIEAGEPLAV